jgi:putative peptidoglycan lipid II flippase
MAIVTAAASVIIIIAAPWLVRYVVAPGLEAPTQELAVDMMRIIALNPLLFAISSVLTSVQQAVGRFFFYALAPSVYNLGIIFGIVTIAPTFGITGVAIGVLIGSIVQLLVSILGMAGLGFSYKPIINWRHRGFRKVLSLLPARSLDQGVDYINILVETNLASRLKEGAITAYQTAFTLHMVPITLIGVAVSTAAFPALSERMAQNRPDLYRRDLTAVLRTIIWLVLPTAVIAYFGRGYLVRLLVADGNPTISSLVGILVVAIVFRSIFHLLTRSFYAQQDTKTPLYISIAAIALNVTLAVILANPNAYGIFGLALAQSITSAFEAFVLIIVLMRRNRGLITADFMDGLVRMISATGLTALATYIVIAFVLPLRASDVGFFALGPKFALIVFTSLVFYVYISWVFKLREAAPVIERTKQFVFRSIKP